ncbi:hypothetical protein KRX19_10800 [Cardiobacteriaceae bacterium TAE3-ERU3]|nr:hypothetical protein [Cardiobacteriaceae bacterium TAE3-ERU3]
MRCCAVAGLVTVLSATSLAALENHPADHSANQPWIAFAEDDNGETRVGFKDAHGNVTIEPHFSPMISAVAFSDLIGFIEFDGKSAKSGILLKDGRELPYKPFLFDALPDCEHEGYIRAYGEEGMLGMLDRDGQWAIAPRYNHLGIMENGTSLALSGATRYSDGEHSYWSGGKHQLLDQHGNVLIDDFYDAGISINWHSLRKTESEPDIQAPWRSWQGTDGYFYSAIDNDRDFGQFLFDDLLQATLQNDQNNFIADGVWCEGAVVKVGSAKIRDAVKHLESAIKRRRAQFRQVREFDPLFAADTHDNPATKAYTESLRHYSDNCGLFSASNHPLYRVYDPDDPHQHAILWFLRMDDTYKLIAVSDKR